jgi:hypothetical protein
MALPEQKHIEQTRQLILNKQYGKFDLMDKLIPKEELLHVKTRILLLDILLLLDIGKEDFPYGSFKAWISRYRKDNSLSPASIENKEKRDEGYEEKEKEQESKKQKAKPVNEALSNFKFTDPDTLKKESEVKMQLIEYINDKQ